MLWYFTWLKLWVEHGLLMPSSICMSYLSRSATYVWVYACAQFYVCEIEQGKWFHWKTSEVSLWRHRILSTRLIRMPSYTVTVATGSQWFAGTDDYIYLTLVGTERCSERTLLDKALYNDFERGAVRCLSIINFFQQLQKNFGEVAS